MPHLSLFAIAAFAVWIWALVDAIKVPDDSKYRAGDKLIWVLVILFAHVIGALIYLAIGRPVPEQSARRQRFHDDTI